MKIIKLRANLISLNKELMILISQEIAYFLSNNYVFNYEEINALLATLKNKQNKNKILKELKIEIKNKKIDNIPFKNILLEKENIINIINNIILEYENSMAMEYGIIVEDIYNNIYCTSPTQLSFLKWFIESKLNLIFDEFTIIFNKYIISKSN